MEHPFAPEALVDLPAGASRHIVRTLRLRPGAALVLFDGHGGEYEARLDSTAGRQARARVDASSRGARGPDPGGPRLRP